MKLLKFLKRKKNFKGGIEIVTPSQISGWIYSKDNSFNKVALFCSEKIISEAFIKLEREDVATKLGSNNKFIGFELNIPNELLSEEKINNKFSVFAISEKSNKKIKLEFFSKNQSIDYKLNYLINNKKLLGLYGHIDGILEDGYIHGWCYKKNDQNPQKIWLRSGQEEKAILVTCDSFREDLKKFGIDGYCGFKISSLEIPEYFHNKNLRFSFDEEGVFNLPQTKEIIFNQIYNKTEIMPLNETKFVASEKDIDYLKYLNDPNSKYSNDWEKIYQYKLLLDLIEEKLNQGNLSFFEKIKLKLLKK